jgi:C1A family cysteine protease
VALDFYTRAWGFHNYRGLKYLTGQVTMPEKGDVDEGGHAVLIIGYDLSSQTYLFKNSWGKDDWAKNAKLAGFGTIPFLYITKHAIATVAKVALQP